MEFFDSKAAVDAMAALQERIHELERNNSKLRKEILKLNKIADEDEQSMSEKETSLLTASDKAQKMLEGASDTLIELRRIKHENRNLEKHLNDLQLQYSSMIDQEKKDDEQINSIEKKKSQTKKLIEEYELLFKEILSPTPLNLSNYGQIPFNNTTITSTSHSLPAAIQNVILELQNLPYPFRDQKIEKKKEIIMNLITARDIAGKIAKQIHELEIQKFEKKTLRRIQPEIDSKASQYMLITQAMSRFKFD